MILVNGELSDHIGITDRGFQYGDGLFETIAVSKGQPVFWQQHWQRLVLGCQQFNLPIPSADLLQSEINSLCHRISAGVIKIIITRGSGGRGYRLPDLIVPTRVISLHPYPEYPISYKIDGIKARFCQTRLGLNPALAGIKHLNRLEQVLARAEWNDPGIQEGIMLDINDNVIEGTMTNLFYIKQNHLYTASLGLSGIAGVIRSIILNIATNNLLQAKEHSYQIDALIMADEVFVCNSIIGIWPINQIADKTYPVGPITKQIQHWFEQFSHQAISK